MSLARLSKQEMYAYKWLLGNILCILSFWGVYTIEIGAGIFALAGLAINFALILFPRIPERIPQVIWKVSPVMLVCYIIGDFVISGGDILPPLLRTVMLLALYRALQYRSRREDLQLILLTLFVVVVTGVLSQDIFFLVQLILYAPAAMLSLFTVTLSEDFEEDQETLTRPFAKLPVRQLAGRLRQRMDRRLLGIGGTLFIGGGLLTGLLFVLLPRFEIGQALPFLQLNTSQSLSGFTDRIQYGDVVDILENNEVAMRVDVSISDPPARPYWRMVVLDAYFADGYQVSSSMRRSGRRMSNNEFTTQPQVSDVSGYETGDWTFYFEGGISRYLPLPGQFEVLRFNNRRDIRILEAVNVIATREINSNTLFYRLEGMVPVNQVPISREDQKLSDMEPVFVDTENEQYLEEMSYPQTTLALPEGENNRKILDEALDEIMGDELLERDAFIRKTIRWLQRDRGYNVGVTIPNGEADRVLRWLDSGQGGHCELFAGAFALLARQAGYPTRIVTGYVGGDWNGYENYYMVRNRDAHAWCEVYDPERGWIRADPTPGNPQLSQSMEIATRNGQMSIDRTFKAYLDSLRVLWYRRVVNFDEGQQAALSAFVAESGKASFQRIGEWFRDLATTVKNWLEEDLARGAWFSVFIKILVPAMLMTGGIYYIRKLMLSLGGRAGYERKMRNRAAKFIKKFRKRNIEGPPLARLQQIRFGNSRNWNDPQEVFKESRRLLRATVGGKR